jgi:hypothetical protein
MTESTNILEKKLKSLSKKVEEILHPEDSYPITQLPEDICIETINPDYICPICLGILQHVVVDCCGHAFCKTCLITSMKHGNKCPSTNLKWVFKTVAPMPILQNLLNSLKIRCIFKEKSCAWTGSMEQLKNHITKDCVSVRVQCKNSGCKVFEERGRMNDHEKGCQFQKLSCKSCDVRLRRKDYQYHEQYICPEKTVSCPENCGQHMARKNYTKHLEEECPNSKITCQFSSMGCKSEVSRKSYQDHLKDDNIRHQTLMLSIVTELQGKVKKLETENEKLKARGNETPTFEQQVPSSPEIMGANQIGSPIFDNNNHMGSPSYISSAESLLRTPEYSGFSPLSENTVVFSPENLHSMDDEEEESDDSAEYLEQYFE